MARKRNKDFKFVYRTYLAQFRQNAGLSQVRLTEWLNTKIKNEKGQALIKKATDIVLNAVRCVFQSYVEALKKSGGFDQKAQIYAFNLAKDIALKQLGDDAKNYIAQNYGDLEEWLKTEIEASINLLKN